MKSPSYGRGKTVPRATCRNRQEELSQLVQVLNVPNLGCFPTKTWEGSIHELGDTLW